MVVSLTARQQDTGVREWRERGKGRIRELNRNLQRLVGA